VSVGLSVGGNGMITIVVSCLQNYILKVDKIVTKRCSSQTVIVLYVQSNNNNNFKYYCSLSFVSLIDAIK